MLIDIIKKGSTDRQVLVRVIDSTDGTPETAVAYNTAGVDLWYRREGATKTSITEATLATVDAAHSDGGFIHVGDGYCRLDLPDAAFASGANFVDVGGTFTGMIVIGGRVKLVGVDLEDAVRGGMTALPNAAADAAGGLPISDAGGLDLDSKVGNLPSAAAGASGGLLISGSNSGTTTLGALTVTGATTLTGALTSTNASNDLRLGATERGLQRDKIIERTVIRGTAATGTLSTTQMTTTGMSPAMTAANQLAGQILMFDHDTTTAALRGQKTDITASSAAANPLLTFTALTTAPANGDTFTIG